MRQSANFKTIDILEKYLNGVEDERIDQLSLPKEQLIFDFEEKKKEK